MAYLKIPESSPHKILSSCFGFIHFMGYDHGFRFQQHKNGFTIKMRRDFINEQLQSNEELIIGRVCNPFRLKRRKIQ